MLRLRHFVALLGLSLLAVAFDSSLAVAARMVHVDLLENNQGHMIIATSAENVKAGEVTFEVTNKSSGIEHEFLIARLNVAPENVPIDQSKDIVKESALKDVQELGDLDPGKSGTMTLNLKAGKYLLFCNLPGHYEAGMHHVLTVTQ